LKARIAKGDDGEKWDVFLFVGYAAEGQLVFEEDGGTGYQLVRANVLRDLLDAKKGPKLIILNASKEGTSNFDDRLSLATAAEMLVSGIAAVVTMQFDTSDTMWTKFASTFFSNLMLNVPVEQAMTLTRVELQSQGLSEWISPVLYIAE